ENAASLARAIAVSRAAKPRGASFLHRLIEIEDALEWTNMSLTASAEAHHAFTLSAEWLLDNAYLIREQVTDLRKSLPQKYYGKLPLIASGPNAGLPRVYQVAAEMVAETDGALEPDIIRRFLAAFQAITPLDIGELWALPLMLRLQLLECIRTLAIQVDQQQRESEEADFWANRLIVAALRKSSGGNFSNRPAGRMASWLQIRLAFTAGWILRRVIDAGARWRKSPDGQIVRNKKLSITPSRWRRPRRTKLRAMSAIT